MICWKQFIREEISRVGLPYFTGDTFHDDDDNKEDGVNVNYVNVIEVIKLFSLMAKNLTPAHCKKAGKAGRTFGLLPPSLPLTLASQLTIGEQQFSFCQQ